MPREAKIKKRSDGFYQRSITIGRNPDGKLKRKTIYAKTLKELERKAADFERQLRHGTLSNNEKMTFGELAEIWLRDYKPQINANTRTMYKTIIDTHLIPELAPYKLKDLKTHHLQLIINRLAEKRRSESTLKKIKLTATQILDVAMDNDVIYRNVFTKVSVPSIDSKKRRPLTEEEVDLVTRTYQGHRMGIPALLLLYCGIRRGELVAITWNDIDLNKKSVSVSKAAVFGVNQATIESTKTVSGNRNIPIPDTIFDAVKAARKNANSTMVCPAADGSIMSKTAFIRAWNSYMHYLNLQAGGKDATRSRPKVSVVDRLTPHMFRHTYATMLYNAGVDIKSAQRFLGHADIKVTLKIYTHLSEQKEQEAIAALNQHLTEKKRKKS